MVMEEEFSGTDNAPESASPETAERTKAASKTRRPKTKNATDATPETVPKKPGRPRLSSSRSGRRPAASAEDADVNEQATVTASEIVAPVEGQKPPKKRRSPAKKKKEAVTPESGIADAMPPASPDEAAPDHDAQVMPPEGFMPLPEATEDAPAKKRPGRRRRRTRKNGTEATAPIATGDDAPVVLVEDTPSEQVETLPVETGEGHGWSKGQPEESGDYRDTELLGNLPDDEPEDAPKRVSKLLINAEEPEECRLALLENGLLESIHVSTVNRAQIKNNIYKAKIAAIEPNLQAAFVEYGGGKNGFLPFAEIHPEYYKNHLPDNIQKLVSSRQFRKLSISDVLEKGGELLVQVVKEEIGKKGANMTTYLSIPGRSVVLMPGSDSTGISRKIDGETRRSQLREAMLSLNIPEDIGWIVRTAGSDITKAALARDVEYLLRLWEDIRQKGQEMEGVGQLYEDHLSVPRFLREHFDPSIEEILVDDQLAYDQVLEFVALLPEEQRQVKVRLHKGSRPIFNQFSIEDQIESIYQPKVNLPSGGSIVIDATEALVAIDVNSGSTGKGQNFEETIFQANMEAAAELARQLRLRDLGGLIVVDFIDMRNRRHIREVEQQVKRAMKRDKARVDISHISKFGLMQISRQKLGAPIESGSHRVCPHCKGRGLVRSVETLALFYLRRIQTGASRKNVLRLECRFPLDVAGYLLNAKRRELADMEERHGVQIVITADPFMKPADHEISFDKEGKEGNGKKQA